jgi:hypothetical protein
MESLSSQQFSYEMPFVFVPTLTAQIAEELLK